MACDRFVRWPEGSRRPTAEEVRLVVEDYLGGYAERVDDDGRSPVGAIEAFFVAWTSGRQSHPLRRIVGASPSALIEPEAGFEARCIEVWVHDDCVDVLTRHQDAATNALARGLAAVLAGYWAGKLEEG